MFGITTVLIGLMMLGAVTALVGAFAFLRKNTLLGDAISHAVLPGVCLGFLLFEIKDPWLILLGSAFTGFLGLQLIQLLTTRTKLSNDSALAIVTVGFFGVGSALLSFLAKSPSGQQSGLKDYLFGKAATMVHSDLYLIFSIGFIVVCFIAFYLKPLKVLAFNPDFLPSIGFKRARFENLLAILTVLVIVIGLQAVGVVLMSALLIGASAAASYWTRSFRFFLLLSMIFGMLACVLGTLLSLSWDQAPTGPWIVMVLFVFSIITLLFAKERGYFALRSRQKRNQQQIGEENVLKWLYQLTQEREKEKVAVTKLLEKRIVADKLQTVLFSLQRKGWVDVEEQQRVLLTDAGRVEARRIVRLHRLWEVYLTNQLKFKKDHIHGTAETIEHLITEDLELELLAELNRPVLDPHNKNIPYSDDLGAI